MESPDYIVCDRCLTENDLRAHYCRNCNAPLTTIALNDPLGQIRAEGDFLTNLQNAPRSWTVTVGTLLLCLPPLLLCVLAVVVMFHNPGPIAPRGTFKEYAELAFALLGLFVFLGFYFYVFGKIMFRALKNQFSVRK